MMGVNPSGQVNVINSNFNQVGDNYVILECISHNVF